MNWLLIQFLIQGEIYVRNYHIFISVYNGIHLQKKYCASNSFIEFSKETLYIYSCKIDFRNNTIAKHEITIPNLPSYPSNSKPTTIPQSKQLSISPSITQSTKNIFPPTRTNSKITEPPITRFDIHPSNFPRKPFQFHHRLID